MNTLCYCTDDGSTSTFAPMFSSRPSRQGNGITEASGDGAMLGTGGFSVGARDTASGQPGSRRTLMSSARPYRIALLLLPVVLLATGVWWWQREPGMNLLERWCADQLRRIAGDLLVPKLEFSGLQLELPVTVTLDNVSLTSDGVAIITMSSMRLEFRERPKRGHPLVIEAATFVDPQVRLIGRSDGTLQGFAGFMKSTTGERYEDGGSSRPSDFLAIRRIAIRDGMLEWAPAGREHPMRFDQLEMDLTTSPDADRPGWYEFKANIDRPPIVQLSWDGGISIDTGDLAFDDTTLQVDLSQDRYASLTPSVQDFLRRYSIVGDLTLHTTGHVPLDDARATDLTFDASLQNASAALGAYQFPIESAQMKATFRQMRLSCDPLSVKAFGGQIDATGTLGFVDARAFTLKFKATDVLIQDMLRPVAGKAPRFAGKIGLQLDADGERRDLDTTMKGTGTLTIADGRLINIPAVGALMEDLKVLGKHEGGSDRGEVDFTLASDRATIGKLAIQSKLVAGHGTGDIHYDGRLDLRINAGVVEKVEDLLGELGDILGALTDRLLPYQISGTWSKPIVTPEPLGLPIGGAGHEEE